MAPEPYPYFPAVNSSLNIKYTGPVFWKGFRNLHEKEFDKLQPDGRTIYLTFGGTGFDADSMVATSNLLIQNGYRVIVTASTITDKERFAKNENLLVFNFLDGEKISKLADLIVCHGGYGTMAQALLAKKPILAIPYNFSQFIHALRFQELGLGRCLTQSPLRSLAHLLAYNWQQFEQNAKKIKPDTVLQAVNRMMQDYDRYINSINDFVDTITIGNGEVEAMNAIKQFIGKNSIP